MLKMHTDIFPYVGVGDVDSWLLKLLSANTGLGSTVSIGGGQMDLNLALIQLEV